MIDVAWTAAAFAALATAVHLGSGGVGIWRLLKASRRTAPASLPPVSIVRPVRGIDTYDPVTLNSTFELDYPSFEIIFCAQSADDAAVPLVEALMRKHSHVEARLLIGDHLGTQNPKLNNIAKGWRGAKHQWVVLADCNVLMPRDYVQQLFAAWRDDTGLVSSPPAGSHPDNFASELECAFLNSYQARWQLTADWIGYGFAQGKSMLWRKSILDDAGGIGALAREIAEDAAATKIVRATGRRVRLVDRFFAQPLGPRTFRDVWARQLRWAQLRRHSFPLHFAPEILSGGVVPFLAYVPLSLELELPIAALFVAFVAVWYGSEALLARAAGWPLSWQSPISWMLRDILLVPLWISAWLTRSYTWRGHAINVTASPPASAR